MSEEEAKALLAVGYAHVLGLYELRVNNPAIYDVLNPLNDLIYGIE